MFFQDWKAWKSLLLIVIAGVGVILSTEFLINPLYEAEKITETQQTLYIGATFLTAILAVWGIIKLGTKKRLKS